MATRAVPKNIEAAGPECLQWNPTDIAASLQALLTYVETEAQKSIDWYWRNKRWKSVLSRWIQFLAVVFTSAGALVPIVGKLANLKWLSDSLWASLLVGAAAALLAVDKAFGFSTGWVRYVLTATTIRGALESFRMDWAIKSAKALPSPTPAQIEELMQCARNFRVTVEGLVLQETRDWVAEFQSNLAQVEKDVTTQLAALKTATEKAAQRGSIQLTVPNAGQADGARIQIRLENSQGPLADETVTGSTSWVKLGVPPDHYQITVTAAIAGLTKSATLAIVVKPGEVTTESITLPVSSA